MAEDQTSRTNTNEDGNTADHPSDDDNIIFISKPTNEYRLYSLHPLETSSPELNQKWPPFVLHSPSQTSVPQPLLDKYLFEGLPAYMSPDRDIHVLISTLSGTGQALVIFDYVLSPLLDAVGLDWSRCTVTNTTGPDSVMDFARSTLLPNANMGVKQTVIMLSGDGGMVDVLNGLLGGVERSSNYMNPVLSLLPLGTANALFHSLHRSSPPASGTLLQALRTLLHGRPHPLPSFRATFSPGARLLTDESRTAVPIPEDTLHGAVVASYGLHSTLVADSDTPAYRVHGAKRFGMVANDLLFPPAVDGTGGDVGGKKGMPHGYKAQLTLYKEGGKEEKMEREEHGYILTTLVSNLEKTFLISPESKPLDGKLRILHFGVLSGEKAMGIMMKAYEGGKHVESIEVAYEEVEGIRVDFEESGEEWKWRRCCVDGLIVGVEEGGWMEVRREAEGAVDVVVYF